eukprot:3479998-Alexandrium_andersonii.AAC.1
MCIRDRRSTLHASNPLESGMTPSSFRPGPRTVCVRMLNSTLPDCCVFSVVGVTRDSLSWQASSAVP